MRLHAPANAGCTGQPAHVAAARGCNHSASLLALSVLTDSAMEHYRGSFENPAMFAPLASSALTLLASLHGGADGNARRHRLRHAVYVAAGATGVAGAAFHLYNVGKRPGGFRWENLFHAAPIGAPGALFAAGALGVFGERLRDAQAAAPRMAGMPAGRALALLAGIGLFGTVMEAGLLHFRGAFQHRAMYVPVTVPPVAAALLVHAAVARPDERPWTRLWLRLTTALGFVGAAFHARGIARRQGGWRNWSQNLFAGPPLPAPPGFSALAMAGLAALRLRRRER
ncbi:hypothetical protein AKI39_18345 [Bordetella sp. H567]|nr:hypothetical protein AKI39_18345 [Bordetella sp. H567]